MLEKSVTIACHISAGPPKRRGGGRSGQNKIEHNLTLSCLLVHRIEEIFVGLRILHLVEQELHRIDGAHLHEDAAKHPHFLELAFLDQQLFLARAGLADVERWEDALVRNLAVKHDFRVACTLKFLENDFIHAAAGIDQSSRDDRQRTAFLNVPRRAKEALRALQGVRIDAAGQDLTR